MLSECSLRDLAVLYLLLLFVDIDECAKYDNRCGPANICDNLPGCYNCTCGVGYSYASTDTGHHAACKGNDCQMSKISEK